jgi:DNA repair ATPase RecN
MRNLRISKLILEGEKYKRTLVIDKSLTIIKGDGFSGKSLFLKLIEYCLGSKSESIDLTVQTELDQYCDVVFLEITINDKIYTLSRH